MEEVKKIKESLFDLFISIALTVYSIFANGFVFLKLYNWFILTSFDNLPKLNLMQIIGIMLFLSICRAKTSMIKDEFLIDKTERHLYILISPWLLLLISLFFK